MRRFLIGLVITMLVSGCGGSNRLGGPGAIPSSYLVEDLGKFAGSGANLSLNNDGDVLVVLYPSAIPEDPQVSETYLWAGGTRISLGPEINGRDMNNLGQIVYESRNRSYFLEGGVSQDMGSLDGSSDTQVSAINDLGQAVGMSWGGDYDHPFLWQDGQMTDLGPDLDGAYAINNLGVIVARTGIWKDGSLIPLPESCSGNAINDHNQMAGSIITEDIEFHAILWENGQLRDLGTLGGDYSSADGINDQGFVVGLSAIPESDEFHAFIWNGELVDLNTRIPADSGWELTGAQDINETGQIAGIGMLNGVPHVFLLTP